MRRLCLLLFAPALLAGCSDRGDRSHLAETSWRFERIDGERPQSSGAELTFDKRKIGVQVGCNHLGGPWRMDENRLFAGPLAQTEMACSESAWNQERAIGALLVATPRMSVEGNRMTLQSSGHTAELVRVEGVEESRKGG
ncbi:heat shock protein HslJ [Novosphingobium sp. CF614]|uniref:META domain-containing protein n=1 Tax=Novosphingobium sp. CF614 TaxID=1884364 RepID=UPI0008E846B5|nr:META domain-containing protein [Novosphingobium sp. CF614]SFG13502.1 heat shock protein HslJ [Novosphingobium sp. CF614]